MHLEILLHDPRFYLIWANITKLPQTINTIISTTGSSAFLKDLHKVTLKKKSDSGVLDFWKWQQKGTLLQ